MSGPIGHQTVHFEAPAAGLIDAAMDASVSWFEAPADTDLVVRAAVAHLWFVTIHLLDDGNGRIARAITDMMLARSDRRPQRAYSMSKQILSERDTYYRVLERTQRGTLEFTDWLVWFLECLGRAIAVSEEKLSEVLSKARFWQAYQVVQLNARQRNMVNRLVDGFEENLTTARCAGMTRCSHDTALRAIADLIDKDILARNPGAGHRTSYRLNEVRN